MIEHEDRFDVVVAGGGPGGAATAGLLAQRGHRVLVLEKEKFPRYHIGESLITGALPTLDALGLVERVEAAGFMKKYGGTLMWGRNQGTWGFRFTESSLYEYAFQVRRAEFDALLLGRARELGAEVVEDATVKAPVVDGERITGVTYTVKGDPTVRTASADLLVDATGQSRLLGRHFDHIEWHDDLRNIATWTYLQGCRLYGGTKRGDIVVENRPSGWFWFIPLADGTTSVGYVTPVAELKASGTDMETLFHRELAATEEVSLLTADARRVAAFRTTKDWSYTSRRFAGPGWAAVGDAAAFVDPLLSTGVTLALRGAAALADSADAALRDPDRATEVFERYERGYRSFLESVIAFVRFFYDRTKNKEEYWDKAQETIDPARQRPREADFATMLSGLTGIDEIFEPAVSRTRRAA